MNNAVQSRVTALLSCMRGLDHALSATARRRF